MFHRTSLHLSAVSGRIFLAVFSLASISVAIRAQTVIPATPNSNYNANSAGQYILNAGDTRAVATGNSEAISIGASSGVFDLTINGTVSQGGGGRGIRTSSSGAPVFNITIGSTGIVKAAVDDAFQGRIGTVNLTNLGMLYSGPNVAATPSSPVVAGRGLNLRDVAGGTVVNGSLANNAALIRSDGGDAVRVGRNIAFTNYGILQSAGVVNDSSSNNVFSAAPNNSVAENFSAGGGFSFEDPSGSVGATGSSLANFGTITGARHGVQAGALGSDLSVTNQAGAQIIGRNGSGVGFDTVEADAGKITVNNSGLIRGDYAGVGNIIDRTGNASFTHDGDGDGVDIDGAATINNYASGEIIATGAGGFDSSGRANSSDGISFAGGTVMNDGVIRGAGVGIVVNNDTAAGRNGIAATTIVNNAGATIEGQNGYAIRLENKLGDARDDDSITNSGTIVGGGIVPDATGTVLLQDGTIDTNSTGTLDGVSYVGTGSGRFVKGDGSAIQMGEGNDVLTNSGAITGNTGRAINMEGGNDKVTVKGGAIVGSIDGGSGTDQLHFDLGSPAQSFIQNGALSNFEQIDIHSGNVTMNGNLSLGLDSNQLTVHKGGILDLGADSLTLDYGSILVDGALKFLLSSELDHGQLLFSSNTGGLTLGSTSMLKLDFEYAPIVGQQFTLLDFVDDSSWLTGIFSGLNEGDIFSQQGMQFQISYLGNGGHDVVLTRTAVPDGGTTITLLAGALGAVAFAARRSQGRRSIR